MSIRSYACDNGDCHACTGRGYGYGMQGQCTLAGRGTPEPTTTKEGE